MSETASDAVIGQAVRQRQEAIKEQEVMEAEAKKVSHCLIELASDLVARPEAITEARVSATSMGNILKLAANYTAAKDHAEKTRRDAVRLGLETGPPVRAWD